MLTFFEQYPRIVAYFSDKTEGNMSRRWGSNSKVKRQRDTWLENLNIDPTRTMHINPENGARTVCFSTLAKLHETVISSERNVLEGDAVFTDMSNLFLTLPVADCALLFVYEQTYGIVGLIHAGWHGLNQSIVTYALQCMKNEWGLIDLSHTYIEVSPYFHNFRKLCKDVSFDIRRFWAKYNLIVDQGKEYHFDIEKMIRIQIEHVGEVSCLSFMQAYNTFMNDDTFYSHRKWVHGAGASGRQMGVIGKTI